MISTHLTMMTCIPWPALRVGDSLRGEPTCGTPTTAALTSGPFRFVCFMTQHQRLWRKIWQFVWPGWRPRLTTSDLVATDLIVYICLMVATTIHVYLSCVPLLSCILTYSYVLLYLFAFPSDVFVVLRGPTRTSLSTTWLNNKSLNLTWTLVA